MRCCVGTPIGHDGRAGVWLLDVTAAIFFCGGILAASYNLYDLKLPNRFVGDMYGFEVMFRLFILTVALVPMVVGGITWTFGWTRKSRALRFWGAVMIAIASLVLTVVAVEVGRARQKAEIRKEYPQRSVEELIRIARKDKDVSALDAIMMKRDPQSIPALCQILRDPEESVKLRMVAAQILGQLGGKEAREALEEVGRQDVHQYLREAIDYALEALNRRQERPAKNP
jgi:uncharacterized membrane protein